MKISELETNALLQTATEAARMAGAKAMELLNTVSRIMKTPTELVTEADPLCQDIIIRHIRKSFPGHGILAEEGSGGAMMVESPTDSSEIWWIIDPIDGTNNYAHGLPCFCVSIGIFHNGSPVVGVIYDPNTDCMYTAAHGIQTCCNGRPVQAGQNPISRFAGFAIDSHFDPAVEPALHQIIQLARFRCIGSTALHMAYVAKGALIGALSVSAKLWDIAAGVILIQQAGGIVTSLDGSAVFPIDMKEYNSQRFRILSANSKTHCQLLNYFKPNS